MFRVYDKQNRVYEGRITSPDNSVMAKNFHEVRTILDHYGVICIVGHRETILSRKQVKGWLEFDESQHGTKLENE